LSRTSARKSAYNSTDIRAANAILRGKWTIAILCVMRDGPVRLGELTRLIPDASKKVLLVNLKQLEATRIVVRNDFSERVLHVEYDCMNLRHPLRNAPETWFTLLGRTHFRVVQALGSPDRSLPSILAE